MESRKNNVTLDVFAKAVASAIELQIDGIEISVNKVNKNNGLILTGLSIKTPDSNISPTIYLNSFFEAYQNGKTTVDEVVDKVIELYNRNEVPSFDINFFTDFNKVKENIIFKLVNTEKNEALLTDVPHFEFNDLSIVFQCFVSSDSNGTATIVIHNAHMKFWNVTPEELYVVAKENTPRIQPYKLRSMQQIMAEMMGMSPDEMEDMAGLPMYVLTNENGVQGSSCILYPDLIKDFAKANSKDLIIIPSSVHEVIILLVDTGADIELVKEMVREVNNTQVLPEEVLSYSVYYYHRNEDRIEMF